MSAKIVRKKVPDKAKKVKLTDDLIVFGNGDKKDHEKWDANRSKWNFPSPVRCSLFGPNNVG